MMFNTIYRLIILFGCLVFGTSTIWGQSPTLLKQNLNANASSSTVLFGNKTYTVQQAVGQGSVIGRGAGDRFSAFQGFFSPYPQLKAQEIQDNVLRLVAFPNPFQNSIHVRFEEKLSAAVLFELHDLSGRCVFKQEQAPSELITFEIPETLAKGSYIVFVQSAQKSYSSIFIKTQ